MIHIKEADVVGGKRMCWSRVQPDLLTHGKEVVDRQDGTELTADTK